MRDRIHKDAQKDLDDMILKFGGSLQRIAFELSNEASPVSPEIHARIVRDCEAREEESKRWAKRLEAERAPSVIVKPLVMAPEIESVEDDEAESATDDLPDDSVEIENPVEDKVVEVGERVEERENINDSLNYVEENEVEKTDSLEELEEEFEDATDD